MSRPTHVYIVASPRPRTGKTLLARALIEFFLTDERPVAGFDLDTMDPMLARILPKFALHADINDTRGQVALFDELIVDDEKPKVVDVSAHAYETFFDLMEQIDFATEAPRRSVEPVILYAANSDALSVKSYDRLRNRFPRLTLAPVYNDGIMRGYNLRGEFPTTNVVALPLRIPMLSPLLRTIVDAGPFSFAEFRRQPPEGFPAHLEAEMNAWLKRVNLQFREMELRLLLSSLRGTLLGRSERQRDPARPPA